MAMAMMATGAASHSRRGDHAMKPSASADEQSSRRAGTPAPVPDRLLPATPIVLYGNIKPAPLLTALPKTCAARGTPPPAVRRSDGSQSPTLPPELVMPAWGFIAVRRFTAVG